MATENEVIGHVDPAFVREFADHILGTIPKEKVQAELKQERNARIMQAAGSVCIEDLGQRVAVINPRLYFRMLHSFGHEENWLDDFLADNPMLCAPGYRPKQNSTRHGITYVGGAPVGKGPQTKA